MSRSLWLSGLFFIVASVVYFQFKDEHKVIHAIDMNDAQKPDYRASGLLSRSFNETGTLAHIVSATSMESFMEDKLTIFHDPKVTLFDTETTQSPSWFVTASEGRLLQAQDQLQLSGQVHIQSHNQDSQIQTISTDYLVVEIANHRMHTEQKVTAIGPHIAMTGMGLKADLIQQNIEILQQVETIYEQYPSE